MPEGSAGVAGVDLQVLRAGIRLMALHALGDADAADEVAQESLARAVDALNNATLVSSVGAYVAGIARHVIADHFRARSRTVPLDTIAPEQLADDSADALSALCTEGEHARVRVALLELSDNDRDLMRLCYFDGLTPTEVATKLGMPPERIRQRKVRALDRLRAAFDKTVAVRHDPATAPTVQTGLMQAGTLGGVK